MTTTPVNKCWECGAPATIVVSPGAYFCSREHEEAWFARPAEENRKRLIP